MEILKYEPWSDYIKWSKLLASSAVSLVQIWSDFTCWLFEIPHFLKRVGYILHLQWWHKVVQDAWQLPYLQIKNEGSFHAKFPSVSS